MLNIKPITLLRGSHPDTGTTGQGCFMNVIAYLNGEPQITDESPCVCITVRPIAIWLNDRLLDDERHVLIPYIERALGSATEDRTEIVRRLDLAVGFAQHAARIAKSAAEYAVKSAKSAAEYAVKSTAEYAVKSAVKSAKSAAEYAEHAKSAAEYAEHAKSAAEYAEHAKSAKSAKYAVKSAAEHAKSAAEYAVKSTVKDAKSAAKYAARSAKYAAKYAVKSAEYAAPADFGRQIIDAGLAFLDAALPPATALPAAVVERAERLVQLNV